jgi:hypothetical protein
MEISGSINCWDCTAGCRGSHGKAERLIELQDQNNDIDFVSNIHREGNKGRKNKGYELKRFNVWMNGKGRCQEVLFWRLSVILRTARWVLINRHLMYGPVTK